MTASGSWGSSGCGKYDVFLSFRGSDTRKFFTGHLYRALEQKGINTFMGSKELQKDDQVSDLLLKAIEESKMSIIVFSENYASSRWCLDELVKIMDCVDKKKQTVVPIFYQVDLSDTRTLKTTLDEAFAEHEHNFNADLEKLRSWRSALSRVSNLWAWDSKDYEDDSKLIDDIVEDILNKLMHGSSTEARGLVGIDSHIQKLNLLLSTGVDDVCVVGIHGTGGIGKTTLAKAVYDQVAHQFEQAYFFPNMKEGFMKNGPLLLQQTLLSTISKESVRSLVSFNRGSNVMMERLRLMLGRKKVLLVLDDVDDIAPIETLLGEQHPFGEGSRIIITTRDSQLLSGVGKTYGLTSLPDDEALELFKQYAFRTNQPLEEYNLLSRRAIEYALGLPLALGVVGAFLSNKSVSEWEKALDNIKNILQREIHHVLKMSFDVLDDSERNIFLDIACFFRGMDKDNAVDILDSCGFFPHSRLRVLVNRALISISGRNTLEMHDLLQDMGREIVRQESPEKPGKCSRLWSYEDINHVLTQNTATEAVESVNLDLSKSKLVYLNAEAFVSMKRLRLLKINFCDGTEYLPCDSWDQRDDCKQHLIGDFKYLSHELRCLIWDGFPLKSLPSNFCPKNLFYLSMRYSHLEKLWGGTEPLEKLKSINLGHSEYLTATPDFTKVANLEKLNLKFCSRLSDVHSSISALPNLVFLSFKGCKELQILPSSIHLKSLETLDLSGCSNLEKFPEISGIMKELSEVYLDETAIKELPSSIERLEGIRILSMSDCTSLARLPENFSNLGCLTELTLSGCSKLNHLPLNLGNLASLRKLEVKRSGIKDFAFLTFGKTYGLTSLPDDEALELFKQYAFRTNQPLEEYNLLSRRAIKYALGLPLALRVLGAFLNNKSSVSEWENALKNIKNIPHRDIHHVLRMSFDGLDDSEKNILLDVACFFKGMDKDNAVDILHSCGFFPHSRLRVLVNRALISISGHNTLEMHDLIQDMGTEIVRQESTKNPGKCSRLWSYEDIKHVLTQNTATEAVESINLDLSKSKLFDLNAEAFVRMKRLRWLKINFCTKPIAPDGTEYLPCDSWDQRDDCKQHLIGDFKYLSHELRCLIWDGFPLKSLPSDFCPRNLVYLSMRYSHLEKLWGKPKPLEKLKSINLGHSKYLTATPDSTEAVNLEKLNLECCPRSSDVRSSISALPNLVFLSFKGCKELQILPSSIHLKSLLKFVLLKLESQKLRKQKELSSTASLQAELKEHQKLINRTVELVAIPKEQHLRQKQIWIEKGSNNCFYAHMDNYENILELGFVPTQHQWVNSFTKPSDTARFESLRSAISGCSKY